MGQRHVAAKGEPRRPTLPSHPRSSQLAEPSDSSKTEGATVSTGLSHTNLSSPAGTKLSLDRINYQPLPVSVLWPKFNGPKYSVQNREYLQTSYPELTFPTQTTEKAGTYKRGFSTYNKPSILEGHSIPEQ